MEILEIKFILKCLISYSW